MSYVYIQSESELYTVGFYDPSGRWNPESDHRSSADAADRVHWLNGGNRPALNPQPVPVEVWHNGQPVHLNNQLLTQLENNYPLQVMVVK